MTSNDWAAIALWVAAIPIAVVYIGKIMAVTVPYIVGFYFKVTDRRVEVVPRNFNKSLGVNLRYYSNRELRCALNRVGFEMLAEYNSFTPEFQKNIVKEAEERIANKRNIKEYRIRLVS